VYGKEASTLISYNGPRCQHRSNLLVPTSTRDSQGSVVGRASTVQRDLLPWYDGVGLVVLLQWRFTLREKRRAHFICPSPVRRLGCSVIECRVWGNCFSSVL